MILTKRLEASLNGNQLELDVTKNAVSDSTFSGSDVPLQATH